MFVSSGLGDADLDPRSRKFKPFGKTPIHAALTQGLTWIGVLLFGGKNMRKIENRRLKSIKGFADSRPLRLLVGMYHRCYNPKCKDYKNYGAKGVRVFKGWLDDPDSFVKWAKEHGYRDDLSIDRVAGGNSSYTPENCRWATRHVQANNRRTNHFLVFNGESITIAQFARKLSLSWQVVQYRLTSGWTPEEIAAHPLPLKYGVHIKPYPKSRRPKGTSKRYLRKMAKMKGQ